MKKGLGLILLSVKGPSTTVSQNSYGMPKLKIFWETSGKTKREIMKQFNLNTRYDWKYLHDDPVHCFILKQICNINHDPTNRYFLSLMTLKCKDLSAFHEVLVHKISVKEEKTERNFMCQNIKSEDCEAFSNDVEEQGLLAALNVDIDMPEENVHLTSMSDISDAIENNSKVIKSSVTGEIQDRHRYLLHSGNRNHYNAPHKRDKNYECNVCQQKYTELRNLQNHIIALHNGIKKYECSECHKTFPYGSSLRNHIRAVHKKIKNYTCKECHQKFTFSQKLASHAKRMHSNKQYECNECHKVFSVIENLRRHINAVHLRIKNYECTLCHKRFFKLERIQSHFIVVHKGIKNHECHECHKLFSTSETLRIHTRDVHTRIRNYECQVCHKMFSRPYHVQRHMKNVHKKIKNECINI